MKLRHMLAALSLSCAAASAPTRAATFDDVQEGAVQMFGSAQQYASGVWRSLFPEKVEICIGYGTEKETWLKYEVEKFSKDRDNRNLTIKLVPIGSVTGADAVSRDAGRVSANGVSCTMTAWSPASAAYRDYVLQRTYRALSAAGVQNALPGGATIGSARDLLAAQAPSLVRIPLVFVMWKDTYDAVMEAARKADPKATEATVFTFDGLIKAEQSQTPSGGYITFYMTNPSESNSGFSSLLLMAYDFTNAGRTGPDANAVNPRNEAFWSKVKQFVTSSDGKSLNNFKVDSTGTLFRENFLVNGPQSEISGVVTYENLAIEGAELARRSFQQTYRMIYPTRSVMSDNPYYVFNAYYDAQAKKLVPVPESEKKAAIGFMRFLMEPEQQLDAVRFGFRPGNVQAGIDLSAAGSPFVQRADIGVQVNPPNVRFVSTNNISEGVISNLLSGWKAVAESLR